MAYKIREELVGKRFISVKSDGKLKVGKISDWEWRPGFVRAVSTRDSTNADFTVLVEFDDTGWKSREHIKVHEVFQEFLIEHTLSWVSRKESGSSSNHKGPWPALCFKPVVDKAGLFLQSKRPVEFLSDRSLGIVDEKDISFYREGDENTIPVAKESPDVFKVVKAWTDYQDGQKILLTTPTVLLGYRVEVYRTEGTTQWYTAVIKAYNHSNKSLTLTDDTVLEEHNEDPTLIQMHLIGDGVVDSILNGVDVGVAQRRRPRSTVTKQSSKDSSSIISINRGPVSSQSGSNISAGNQPKLSSNTSSTSSSVTTSTTGSRGAGTKSRAAAAAEAASSLGHSSSVTASETSSPKGQSQLRNQKQTPKRKPDPPPKAAKKAPVGKKLKKSTSDENLETSTSVCKQTCNVVVKRIEEENKKQTEGKEKPKPKPPRLRDKPGQNKKPPDPEEDKDTEPVEDSPASASSSKGQEEPLAVVNVSDSKDSKSKVEVETKEKGKEEVKSKSKQDKEAAHVSILRSDRQQTPSPAKNTLTVATDEKEHGKKSVCDTSITSSVATTSASVKGDTVSNDVTVLTPPDHSEKERVSEESYSGSKHDEDRKLVQEEEGNKVKNDLVGAKPKAYLIKETPEQNTSNNSETGSDSSDQRSEEDMHYKKQILRAGGNISPPQTSQVPSISEGIDVNRSLTDQLAKRHKNNDKYSLNGDGKSASEAVASVETLSSSSSLPSHQFAERDRPDSNSLNKGHDFSGDRQSAFTCVQSSISRIGTHTPSAQDRADSRASDGQLPSHISDDKRPGSRLDDIRSVRSSPGSSPLVIDRHEAVNPYRDPELMRKNPVQSNVQSILAAQQKMSQPSFPPVHAPVPGAGASAPPQSAAAFAGVPALPARSLLSSMPSTMPYTSAHQLPPSISHHLPLPGYPMEAALRAQHHQLAALHQQQQQQLLNYTLGTSPAPGMAAIESLWQRKFPSTSIPAHYIHQKNQEILVGDLLHREHLIQIEQERRELERREAERREMERARKEKERKEILERERLEIEKAEREKAERERIERERQERDRLEKERLERERQEWEQKQNQERILRESAVDTKAAVEQHFAESLTRLATQQGIIMFPPITRGTGRGLIPKTEAQHPLPPQGLPYHEKHYEHRKEEKLKRELDHMPDDKRYPGKPSSDKSTAFPAYPYGTSGYHPSSGMPQPGQKPFFNLYPYASSHSTITPEQLKQRGLNPEPRPVKEEAPDKKHPFPTIPPHSASPVHLNPGYPPKDIKREPHNSVIVKRDTKPPVKIESPVAAHSHHNSPSSSSPRPQHPRPAHTPEHRPDRPLSSSNSPASGIPPHLLHHSSPLSGGPGHLPPSHNTPFRSLEAHVSPRSQSPYKPAASQPPQPQPLDFCKSSSANKHKALEQPQQQPPPVHPGFPSSGTQPSVSMPSSIPYSYNLIQQGLVPNPIYSPGGASHPSGLLPPSQHGSPPHGGPPPNPVHGPKPSQVSPPGSKRKLGSKDGNGYGRKKPKGQSESPGVSQPMSIPVTTPQIITNPSPYTTTSSSSVFSKPGVSSLTSSSSSPSLPGSSLPSMHTGYMDSFKTFVEKTVQSAFHQDEEKAQEKAERERMTAGLNLAPSNKSEPNPSERKSDSYTHPLPGGLTLAASSATRQEMPQTSTADAYNSRIMDTINRVANNQVDTDSDTLSASSPPPQIKPSDTNSPLNRSGNSAGSSHPHHMKKAWLQRHDEDKKSETPILVHNEEDSNSSVSHTRDTISCVENSSATLVDRGQDSSNASPANVVVTLPNGNASDLNHHNDESTSSASESEMQGTTKVIGPKKRIKTRKSGNGSGKKPKADGERETPTSTPPPTNSNNNNSGNSSTTSGSNSNARKKTNGNKRGKGEKESKPKDDSQQPQLVRKDAQVFNSSKQSRDNSPQPTKSQEKTTRSNTSSTARSSPSPNSERSNPSPTFSEGNTANMSPASSASSSGSSTTTTTTVKANTSSINTSKDSKDKKKTRRSKEPQKDSKKSSSFNKPLVKVSVTQLKKTMDPFIQDGPCSEITPKLTKCRECKMTPVQRSKKQPNIFCRFYAFRRLRYNPRGIVTIHGFSELSDADPDDIEPWLPRYPVEEPILDVENSKFIISKVGDKFCELVEQEREAKSWAGEDVKIVWKRAVMGVREMCDVCDTTLFNMHWVCHKCGFVVCLDCYKLRAREGKKPPAEDKWLTCSSNRQAHKASEMMLTQIIPSDALWELGRLIHDIRIKWSIPSNCPCGGGNAENKAASKNGINQQLINAVSTRKLPNGFGSEEHGSKQSKSKKHQEANPLKNLDTYNPDTTSSPLSILAEVASMEPDSNRDKSEAKRALDKTVVPGDEFLEESEKKSNCSTLRELLTKTAGMPKVTNDKKAKKGSGLSTLDDIIQSVVEKNCTDGSGAPFKFLHYTPRLGGWKRELPIRVHNLTETSVLYPDVPHSWLCDGRLLRLHDAHHKGNLQIFQEQWKRGQPVLVSCANKKMNINLWKPEVFMKEFGDIENDVVNCRTGDVIIGHTIGDFWDGFENLSNRPTDDKNDPMLLKLKDWPPGDDFSELLPSRFQDLMQALPLPEYTQRNGKLNLASRLPDFLVRPDLGPKMYNAYGSSHFPKEGTTNLHLDISDAVNVMVYVGVPTDGPGGQKAQEEAAVKAIDDAGCDSITKRRVREVHEIPGALWHIYDAHDADKIRDFLNKVAKERGEIIEKDHDAIHDQSWYLDKELCDRLLKEYGVQGYTIVQCLGDAIFIPAGAPHQVRNLHSCVKVAEDFVSPEHLNHCFRLTQEFRQLSETHSNHEDKLQVKNIIYHAVKDAIAVLREHDPEDE